MDKQFITTGYHVNNAQDGDKFIISTDASTFTIEFAGSITYVSSDQELCIKAGTVSTDGATYIGGPLDVTELITVGGQQVVSAQQPAIEDATSESDAVTKLNDLLAALRTHGLIAS